MLSSTRLGPILYRVKLSGTIVRGDDKAAATKRTYLAEIDAEPILREFARKCALSVTHLWDAPRVVRQYLETGDESLRAAARDAAAWDAAWDAARAAAWAAARDAQKKMLEEMCLAALKKPSKTKHKSA
jgi:hypothetical protein